MFQTTNPFQLFFEFTINSKGTDELICGPFILTIHMDPSLDPKIPQDMLVNISWLVVYLPPWKIWVRQIGSSSQLLGKIKNVPNHQPVGEHLYF